MTSRASTGQGPVTSHRRLPPRSLAARALPRPASPGHLVSPTRSGYGPGEPAPLSTARLAPHDVLDELAGRRRSSRRLPQGSPLAPLREEGCDTLHPRCLPPTDTSRWEADQLSTGFQQPVESRVGAFASFVTGALVTGSREMKARRDGTGELSLAQSRAIRSASADFCVRRGPQPDEIGRAHV